MPQILVIAILLAAVVGGGAFVIWKVRDWLRQPDADHGDWERTLVDWRNLRDEGVLTEEEYRKLRTLAEPRTRVGVPDSGASQRPATGPSGPDHERT